MVLNVTVTGATAPSFLTVYPDQTTEPVVSNLNYGPGQTVPNLVNAKLGADGAVSIANAAGSVQVIVDLEGYFTASGDTSGSRFFPLVNHRILDTRSNIGGYYTPVGPNASIPVTVVGQGGVLDGAAAAVMNTSVTGPTAPSFLTVYPDGVGRPNAANLNFTASQTIANLVSATIGGDGEVDIYNNQGSVNTIADVVGWYGRPEHSFRPAPAPANPERGADHTAWPECRVALPGRSRDRGQLGALRAEPMTSHNQRSTTTPLHPATAGGSGKCLLL